MLLVAVDDTDSLSGGCTTALAAPLAAHFSHLRPDGPPRLVRLNPNIPWKTRGNAAIALRFHDAADLDETLATVRAFVEQHAQRDPRTEPGVVVASEPPPTTLYEAAVTRVVERREVDETLSKLDARAWGGRGVIGASAALAWPAERTSFERIAYRAPERRGTKRDVDAAWVREVEWSYPTTFDSYDLVNDEVVCVPSGPDPVLWGIRGDDPEELARASAILGPERPASETLFLTNQGSDDHLVDRQAADGREYESARLRGRVAATPEERGGAVFFDLRDETGLMRCAAYAPARGFRFLARALDMGDDITVCGGIAAGPDGLLTLGIEKLRVHVTTPRFAGPPVCPSCDRSMHSAGHDAGYRCKSCGAREKAPRTAESIVRPGWHEVPSSARRHLAMPLKRMA